MRTANLILIAPLALLAACSSEQSGTFETEDGGEGTFTINGDGDEAVATVTNEDGTATIRSGKDVSVDLPQGFTVYPGASVEHTTSFTGPEGKGALINMQSDDPPEKLIEHYRKQAEAAGIEIAMDMKMNDGHAIMGNNTEKGFGFTFNATPKDGGTNAQLMIGDGMQ